MTYPVKYMIHFLDGKAPALVGAKAMVTHTKTVERSKHIFMAYEGG